MRRLARVMVAIESKTPISVLGCPVSKQSHKQALPTSRFPNGGNVSKTKPNLSGGGRRRLASGTGQAGEIKTTPISVLFPARKQKTIPELRSNMPGKTSGATFVAVSISEWLFSAGSGSGSAANVASVFLSGGGVRRSPHGKPVASCDRFRHVG